MLKVSRPSILISLYGIHATVPMVIIYARDDHETIKRSLKPDASGFISKSESINKTREEVEIVLSDAIIGTGDIDFGFERDTEIADPIKRLQSLTLRMLA